MISGMLAGAWEWETAACSSSVRDLQQRPAVVREVHRVLAQATDDDGDGLDEVGAGYVRALRSGTRHGVGQAAVAHGCVFSETASDGLAAEAGPSARWRGCPASSTRGRAAVLGSRRAARRAISLNRSHSTENVVDLACHGRHQSVQCAGILVMWLISHRYGARR